MPKLTTPKPNTRRTRMGRSTTKLVANHDILLKRGVDVLMKELGPIETARFLNLTAEKRIESVARHRNWQATLEAKSFFKQVFGKPERAALPLTSNKTEK